MPVPDLRADLLRIAFQLLGNGERPPTFPVEVSVRDADGRLAVVTLSRHDLYAVAPAITGPVPPFPSFGDGPPPVKLRHIHLLLLKHASSAPVPIKVLIKSAGYEQANSYTRAAVTWLIKEGFLVRTPAGVIRGDRPLPPQD